MVQFLAYTDYMNIMGWSMQLEKVLALLETAKKLEVRVNGGILRRWPNINEKHPLFPLSQTWQDFKNVSQFT